MDGHTFSILQLDYTNPNREHSISYEGDKIIVRDSNPRFEVFIFSFFKTISIEKGLSPDRQDHSDLSMVEVRLVCSMWLNYSSISSK